MLPSRSQQYFRSKKYIERRSRVYIPALLHGRYWIQISAIGCSDFGIFFRGEIAFRICTLEITEELITVEPRYTRVSRDSLSTRVVCEICRTCVIVLGGHMTAAVYRGYTV